MGSDILHENLPIHHSNDQPSKVGARHSVEDAFSPTTSSFPSIKTLQCDVPTLSLSVSGFASLKSTPAVNGVKASSPLDNLPFSDQFDIQFAGCGQLPVRIDDQVRPPAPSPGGSTRTRYILTLHHHLPPWLWMRPCCSPYPPQPTSGIGDPEMTLFVDSGIYFRCLIYTSLP